jgi:type II secretory pathway component PulM
MSELRYKITRALASLNEEFISHPVTQNLWSFYQSRGKQEQLTIRAVLMALAATLLWLLFISPLAGFANRAEEKFNTSTANYQWMQSHRDVAQQAAAAEEKTMEVLIKESPLAPFITQLKADGESRTTINVTAAPFNVLAESLTMFSRKNTIQISSATINRLSGRNGYVSAILILERN